MTDLTISVAQFAAGTDVDENLVACQELIARAAATSQLVVLPEYSMYADFGKTQPDRSHAETLDGPFVTALRDTARAHGIAVVAGINETDADDDRVSNTLVHLSASGELAGVYRKIHLYDAFGFRESDTVIPAQIDSPLVFELEGVRIGAATCYDLRFPEMSRWLVDQGADVILLPAAWMAGPLKEQQWDTLIRARAIENTVYVAACGQTGPRCAGQSMIVDPMGVTVASAGEREMTIASATIDTQRIADVREVNPSLQNRRFTVAPRTA